MARVSLTIVGELEAAGVAQHVWVVGTTATAFATILGPDHFTLAYRMRRGGRRQTHMTSSTFSA
jgi:hypothetical protein